MWLKKQESSAGEQVYDVQYYVIFQFKYTKEWLFLYISSILQRCNAFLKIIVNNSFCWKILSFK